MFLKSKYFYLNSCYLNTLSKKILNKYIEIIMYSLEFSKKKLEFFNIRGKVINSSSKNLKLMCKINNFKFYYSINLFNNKLIGIIIYN